MTRIDRIFEATKDFGRLISDWRSLHLKVKWAKESKIITDIEYDALDHLLIKFREILSNSMAEFAKRLDKERTPDDDI